jgi:protein SCO1/2
MSFRPLAAVVVALALLGVSSPARAQARTETPAELDGIGIDDRRGAQIPGDVTLRDQEGREVRLSHYLDGSRPTVLVLAYYQCPMLCTLVLNQLKTGLQAVAWSPGDEFRVLTVSIDPRDKPEDAKAKRASYVKAYGRTIHEGGWDFLVGDEAEVRRLADAVGFHYRWDESTQQYAHAAGAFVLTPQGRLSQTLYGLTFDPRTLRLALTEASAGKLGSALDRVLLFCFHYDAAKQGYVVARARIAMITGCLLSLLALASWLARMWRSEASRPNVRPHEAPSS